jgi:hypothetical protein
MQTFKLSKNKNYLYITKGKTTLTYTIFALTPKPLQAIAPSIIYNNITYYLI